MKKKYFQFEYLNDKLGANVLLPVLAAVVSDSESYFPVSGLLYSAVLPRKFNTYKNIAVSEKSSFH